jgi:hypothetical protein
LIAALGFAIRRQLEVGRYIAGTIRTPDTIEQGRVMVAATKTPRIIMRVPHQNKEINLLV